MKRFVLISLALLLLAIIIAGGLWWRHDRLSRSFYTDGSRITQRVDDAFVREVLWQPPEIVRGEGLNTSQDEYEPRISADGSTLVFVRGKAGGNADIYIAQREAASGGSGGAAGWSEPQPIAEIDTDRDELGPSLSPDGRTLLFSSDRPGGLGGYDLWMSQRTEYGGVGGWSEPVNLGPQVNSEYNEYGPAIGGPPDGAMLVFASNRPAEGETPTKHAGDWSATLRERYAASDYDLYSAAITPSGFEQATALKTLNTSRNEGAPAFSPAGDFLYFCSDRPGGRGGFDLYRSRRFEGRQLSPEALGGEINTAANEMDPAPDMGGFALIFSSDRSHDAGGAANYDLWRSESREVFVKVGPRAPLNFAAIWAWLAPLLLWLLLLLSALALLAASWKGVRSRRLSLLARCLLASLIAHLILMVLLTFWQVTTHIALLMDHGPTRVVLTTHASGDNLAGQIRGGVSGDLSVTPRDVGASARVESASGQGDSPQAELVLLSANRAQLSAEEAARLQASAAESDIKRIETPATDVQNMAQLQQAKAADVQQTPADQQRDASSEAQARAQGGEAPRATKSAQAPAAGPVNAAAALVQPPAAAAGAVEAVHLAAAAPREAAAHAGAPALPDARDAMRVDASAAQPVPVAQPREGETSRIAQGEPNAPSVRAAQTATNQNSDVSGSAAAAAAQTASKTVTVAPQESAGAKSANDVPAAIAAAVPGDAVAPRNGAKAPLASALASTSTFDAAHPNPANVAAPADAGPSGAGANTSEAGATVSAANATGGASNRAAAISAAAQPSGGAAVAVQTAAAPVQVGGEPAQAVGGGAARAMRDSDGGAVAQTGGANVAASSATNLDAAPGMVAANVGQLALPRESGGAISAAAATQPAIGEPSSALASGTGQRAANDGAAGAAPTAAAVALAPSAAGAPASSTDGAPLIARGGDVARDAATGDGSRQTSAPSSAGALSLDAGLSPPTVALGKVDLPDTGSAQNGARSGEAQAGAPAIAAAGTSAGRAEGAARPGASSTAAQSVALAPQSGVGAGSSSDAAPTARGGDVARDAAIASNSSGAAAPSSGRSLDQDLPPAATALGHINLPSDGTAAAGPAPAGRNDSTAGAPTMAAAGKATGRANAAPPTNTSKTSTQSVALAPQAINGGSGAESRDASPTFAAPSIADSTTNAVPGSAPPAVALAEISIPEAAPAPDLNLRLPKDLSPPNNPYAARKQETRMETVKRMGGSEETEKAVALALDWLARHQSPDGRWATRNFDVNCGECKGEGKFDTDIATTGLALLCFLGADHTHAKDGKYRANVMRGLKWLLDQQGPDGDLRGDETMYSHGIASIALGESLGMTGDPQLREPVNRAVAFIRNALNRNVGGWRYEPRQAGDTSVTGWQVLAMMSAKRAGLIPPSDVFAAAGAWMEKVGARDRPGQYAYQPGQPFSPSMTAEGMFIQELLGVPHDDPRMKGSAEVVVANLPRWEVEPNTYYWYYATLAMFQYQGPEWEKWNMNLTRVLLKNQRTSGAASGSWDPVDNWSKIGGRVYQTAICTLCLEVYYRYLPMYQAPLLANAGSAVGGTVTDADTGRPLPGAMVRLDMSSGSGALVAVTDDQGHYALALPPLPADFVALSASKDGYTPATTNIVAAEAKQAQVSRDFALAPEQSNVIVLEDDPQVHHLGNDQFEGAINSQFQKKAEGLEYRGDFTMSPQQLPPKVRRAEMVLMFKGAQAQNTIFINGQRLQRRFNGSPRDGSFGEFRVEIPIDLLRPGNNTITIRTSDSEGDLDDFEFVNVQVHVE